jgi:MFS family permease
MSQAVTINNTAVAEPEPAAVQAPAPPVPAASTEPFMAYWKVAIYIVSSALLFVTQGLGMNIVNANLYQLQGEFSATVTEIAWMSAAYVAPYASLSIALFKIRAQYGLRRFAEWSVLAFLFASCLNLFVTDLHSAIVIRFISGMAAAPLSSLGFLFMIEAFAPAKKLSVGLSLALMFQLIAAPLARIISPTLLQIDGWKGLYTLEMGLALMVLPIIYLLPLTAPPRAKVIERTDVLSYLLLAVAFGCLAFFFTLGRFYWWFEVPWLGTLLAVAVGLLTILTVIELPRKNPFIDFRWVFSRENVHMAGVLLLFRTVTSEQSATAASFYQQLGLLNDQTMTLYAVILGASVVGGLFCVVLMTSRYVELSHVISLVLIGTGAFLDSQSTNLTRPEQMYWSQAMVACGAAMFLPPVMAKGFGGALAKGLPYLVNFIAIFLFTQISGSLMATAALGSFVTIREKFHSSVLLDRIMLTDPLVAQRVTQLAASYGKVITDQTILHTEGLTLLGAQVTKEAYVLAYADTFLVLSVGAFVSLALLLIHLAWLRLKAARAASMPAAAPQS